MTNSSERRHEDRSVGAQVENESVLLKERETVTGSNDGLSTDGEESVE